MNISVIIAAAGASTRMGSGRSKTLLPLGGRPVLQYSLDMFAADSAVAEIVVAAALADMAEVERICSAYPQARVICGGAERGETVRLALAALRCDTQAIAVHDGARPLVQRADWEALKAALPPQGGAILAARPVDSIKLLADDCELVRTSLERSRVALAQTPQLFRAEALRRAYAGTATATDDAALVEQLGLPVAVVYARQENFKLTYAADLQRAELHCAGSRPERSLDMLRIGSGWDSHRIVSGRPLVLGGVVIDCGFGLLGHSDADVLLHAVIDALFGAAGLPDIGCHFPDTSEEFRGISSLELLRRTGEELRQYGWKILNIDSTLVAQQPRLAAYIPRMRENMAQVLQIDTAQVNIKAKTAEGLDSVGRGEAMMAQAVALLQR